MNQSNKLCETESESRVQIQWQWPGLLGGTDGERPEDPGVHPPDEGHGAGHDLLPLVLGVLPDSLPGLLAGLQAGVAPDVLQTTNITSLLSGPLTASYLDLVQVPDLGEEAEVGLGVLVVPQFDSLDAGVWD